MKKRYSRYAVRTFGLLVLLFSKSIAIGQDFPFTIEKLINMQYLSLDSINKSMFDAGMPFENAYPGDHKSPLIISYRLPSGVNSDGSIAWVDIERNSNSTTNIILVRLDIKYFYNNLQEQLMSSDYKLFDLYLNRKEYHKDVGQIFRNSHTTIFSIISEKKEPKQGEPLEIYKFWIVSNQFYDKFLKN